MIEASIIIGTYNQKEILKKTLDSLLNQTCPPDRYEIVLADSMSNDGTKELIENLHPLCRLNYFRQENRGKVNARNNAIRKAQGKILLFTDADILADKNWIEAHLNAHAKKKSAAFSGKTFSLPSAEAANPQISFKFKPLQKISWNYFLTGNVSISKELILKAGLFDENFIEYGWEDIELGYRLNKMGVPLYYLPSAVNHHVHPVSKKKFINIMYKMGKSAAIFYKKHPSLQIKYYLGLNPIALGLYKIIKRNKWLYNFIQSREDRSSFFRYIFEQYYYLSGAMEGLANG